LPRKPPGRAQGLAGAGHRVVLHYELDSRRARRWSKHHMGPMKPPGALSLILLLTTAVARAGNSQVPDPQDRARLDSLLLAQATRLLARYGDTFYVLGNGVSPDGAPVAVATRHWAPLDAPPDEWRDSLVMELRDQRDRMRSAAYLLDRWRQLDPARADSMVAVFHFESAAGACSETWRPYHFDSSTGAPLWGQPVSRPCAPDIWVH
jgi:hypothetical protein